MGKKHKARTGSDRRTLKLGPITTWRERRRSVERRKPRHSYFF